jgi:hypothetical protein
VTLAIRNPKDFWAGVLYMSIGLAALWIAQDYKMGTAMRMGPGYFPTLVSGLLTLVGFMSLVRSFFRPGEPVGYVAWGRLALVSAAIVLFAVLLRGAGAIVALPVLMLVGAYASRKFRWLPSILLAAGVTAFCIVVFMMALGIPLPIVGRWFDG